MLPFVYQENQVRVVKIDEEPWFVAKDLCDVLEIKNPTQVINRLDADERAMFNIGRQGDANVVNESGMYSLILGSRKQEAREFKRWITHDVLPSIRKTGSYSSDTNAQLLSLQKSFDELTEKINKTGFLNPLVNYRHQFEQLNVYYKDATGDDSHRGIHEACGDYFGFPVPYSKDITTTLRDYVLCHISDDMETSVSKLQQFIAGIKSKSIKLSSVGHWYSQNGFGGNDVEWPKILKEFNGKCAYCGKSTALIPEHIVPQSVLAKESPQDVDLIFNVVPSCGCCNHSKGKQEMESWYRKQPFFSEVRLRKIKRHQLMYSLEEL